MAVKPDHVKGSCIDNMQESVLVQALPDDLQTVELSPVGDDLFGDVDFSADQDEHFFNFDDFDSAAAVIDELPQPSGGAIQSKPEASAANVGTTKAEGSCNATIPRTTSDDILDQTKLPQLLEGQDNQAAIPACPDAGMLQVCQPDQMLETVDPKLFPTALDIAWNGLEGAPILPCATGEPEEVEVLPPALLPENDPNIATALAHFLFAPATELPANLAVMKCGDPLLTSGLTFPSIPQCPANSPHLGSALPFPALEFPAQQFPAAIPALAPVLASPLPLPVLEPPPAQRAGPAETQVESSPKPRRRRDSMAMPEDLYERPLIPQPWGRTNGKKSLFRYDQFGQLQAHRAAFWTEDLKYYISEQSKRSLVMWIQVVPAKLACRRRQGADTWNCRWVKCPAPTKSIAKGFFRVCFDECPQDTGRRFDPYNNAMYMHLWCMEECFDFIDIVKRFDVRADTREFEQEKNRAALTRDWREMYDVWKKWKEVQMRKTADGVVRDPKTLPPEGKLWSALTETHLSLQGEGRQEQRLRRRGLHRGVQIDEHRGNLLFYCWGKNEVVQKNRIRTQRAREIDNMGDSESELDAASARRKAHRRPTIDESDSPVVVRKRPAGATASTAKPRKRARWDTPSSPVEPYGPSCIHYGPVTRRKSQDLRDLARLRQRDHEEWLRMDELFGGRGFAMKPALQ